MARQQHSVETKAAVMAALLAGQSVASVAREYRIKEGTVKAWYASLKRSSQSPVAEDKRQRIGELLVTYLDAALRALTAQVDQFSDKTWLARQPASEVAVLHGVIADKTIRILEALAVDGEAADVSGVHPSGSAEV